LWFLVGFGFLAAGLVGGTIMFAWRPAWVWPFPVAGFVGYVLAFRRGLLLWNPNIDRTWREYVCLDRSVASQEVPAANEEEESSGRRENLRVARLGQHEPSSRPLRAIR
jgi:MFS family permease